MRVIYQGETIPIETAMVDTLNEPLDLSSATCKFSLKYPDLTVIDIIPTVSLNVISVALATDQTTQTGIYTYQFTVTLDGEIKKKIGVFKVISAVK